MRGRKYTKEIKDRADLLRAEGKSYKEIGDLIGIPKSTLSVWFGKKYKNIFNREAQLEHLARVRKLAHQSIVRRIEKRNQVIQKVAEKVVCDINYNKVIAKLALSLLYWAEGSKHKSVSGLIFVNTDPVMMKLYIDLLRDAYNINEEKFSVRIHLHHYHEKKKLYKFWSELLQISEKYFAKPYLKPRSKKKRFRRNSKGICLLRYGDSNIRRELMAISQIFADRNPEPSSFNG